MFVLAAVRDTVRIIPSKLSLDFEDAIADELNAKYCNKVVPHCGLAISVFDVQTIDDPYVHPGDGAASVMATFRLVMFRPFNGQVLAGKVRSSDEATGVRVTLGFFDEIIIPPGFLPDGTRWDSQEQVWVWQFDGNDLFIDPEEPIRFRVLSEVFVESAPTPKEVLMSAQSIASDTGTMPPPTPPPSHSMNPPYKLIASIAEDGLGLLSWWGGQ